MRRIALVAALLVGAAAPAPLLLREQAWTAPGDLKAPVERPGECLATSTPEIEIGRTLFRSPVLFGGPTARLGLSCESCHTSGRINAHFLLPELTDRAGAADVTSEWASRVRGVVEEEFQGEPMPPRAFAALIAYLRALDADACAAGTHVTLANAAEDVRRALAAAEAARDLATARLVLLAAQDAIGLIVERLPAERFAAERGRLASLARELGGWRDADDLSATLSAAGPGWRARFDAAIAAVAPREAQTYFNEATLAEAMAR
jgi:hypothetical protein